MQTGATKLEAGSDTGQRESAGSPSYRRLKALRDKYLSEASESVLRSYVFPAVRLAERLVFGGNLRRRVLIKLLRLHYQSRFRSQWLFYSQQPPHFFDNQMGFFNLTFGNNPQPFSAYRAFLNSEIVKDGDCVLDIGCGDGFFSRRFLSPRAAHVDAIDIEPSAIQAASRYNSGPTISYTLQDAVATPFPNPAPDAYDVVVWDGALGHFPGDSTILMLNKIKRALRPAGVFAGSESLGRQEGLDHLQFFDTAEDLVNMFRPFFPHIYIKTFEYDTGYTSFPRREAYWRCSDSPVRLEGAEWQKF